LCVDQEFKVKKFLGMALAMGCAAAFAQTTVTDPQATVPAVIYQSVFKESPTGVETQSVDWKKANADVAQFTRGHVDILKWEEAQIKTKPVAKPVAKPAETQAAPPAPAVPSAAHKH
jgi:hypothetical protein